MFRKLFLPPVADLLAFEAAARHASISRAAEELHRTQSAVSRQVRQLEAQLGQALFTRVRQRVEVRLLARVRRQALVLRWSLLIASLSTVLGITLWHYAVIDELRLALTNFYASQ